MAVTIKECIDYIIMSGHGDAFRDATNLLRNIHYGSEEEISSKITGTAFIKQIEDVPDTESLEHDEKTDCEYIREKYSLYRYDICKVCNKCISISPPDENREKQLMRAIFSSNAAGKIFSAKPEIHEYVLERFRIYTPYKSENTLNSYAMVNRMIYETLFILLQEGMHGKKDRTTPIRQLIPADVLYERWKFFYTAYCDGDGENNLVRTAIDYYYENPYDRDDVFEYYLPEKGSRKKKKEEVPEPVPTEPAGEKTVREQAIEFDNISVLLGGEEKIDRNPPIVIGNRSDMLVPEFTQEEIDNAGFVNPSEDMLNSIGYEAIKNKVVSMDVIKIKGKEGPVLMLCIQASRRCIIKAGQLIKLSVFLGTKKNAITKEPIALFKFMQMNGQKMKLSIFHPLDRKKYYESVFDKSGKQFSLQALNDEETMYHKAYSYSMADSMDNIELLDGSFVLKDPITADETKNTVRAEIRTILSPAEWYSFKREILTSLVERNQFEIHGMLVGGIKNETKEFKFLVARDKCRGFSSVLTKTISEHIRTLGYYPNVAYTVE